MAASQASQAKAFISALATIQTAKQIAIAYAVQTNCADLQSHQILLDATVIDPYPFRPQATMTERLDILAGLCLHEVLHLEYSSPALCRRAKKQGAVFAHIHNILEDEFIESQLSRTSPGYVGYLQAMKDYIFNDAHRARVGEDLSLLNTLLLFVRAPQRLRWSDAARYGEELTQIRGILTPFPASGKAVYVATRQIYRIFQRGHPRGPAPTDQLLTFLEAAAVPHRDEGVPAQEGEALSRVLHRMGPRRLVPSGSRGSEVQLQGNVIWETPPDDRPHYEADRAAVQPYIKSLRRWLRDWDLPPTVRTTGTTHGRLDRRHLHTVPVGNTRLFQRREHPGARRLTIALLIDESGSMAGREIAAARQVAILFKEALSRVNNVELFIFGHSADIAPAATHVFRYWAPGWKRRYSLSSVAARKNNRDGVAIWAVAREVQRLTSNREIILLVISDGQPQAVHYQGEAAMAHTRTVVKQLQRDMVIIHIAMHAAVDSARMFDHYVHLTDIAAFPLHMGRLLRQLLGR